MISRSFAILLAILGLYLSAFAAAAQPRGGGDGWRGGGRAGFSRGGFGEGRFGGGRYGGGPGFGGRGFAGPMAGYGRGYGMPRGGGYGRGYEAPPAGGYGGYMGGGRGYAPPPVGYGGAPRGFGGPARPFGGDWSREQNEVRRAMREGRQIPLGRAIEAVRRRVPGRELDAGLEAGPNGRAVYRLRWAGQNGRRQDYIVDAGTGAVLGVQGGP